MRSSIAFPLGVRAELKTGGSGGDCDKVSLYRHSVSPGYNYPVSSKKSSKSAGTSKSKIFSWCLGKIDSVTSNKTKLNDQKFANKYKTNATH
ncbi:hypothetical protein CDAR_183661 [Caerostris darwini]|uniref:Uncharacterized protein n=1 Tax=Caerostris darwini TaxID=1538125 RepID=A0AAV4Q070_9ARAC|nr:hypothetical protein CDAR_183661 [Caerostris darwini]